MAAALAFQENSLYNKKQYARFGPGGTAFAARIVKGLNFLANQKKMVNDITSMDVDFSKWYTDIVKKAELMDYSSVKGCMIIEPYGYAIWENIQHELDDRFKATGHQNVYMPLFIPESLLQKEKDHVKGFAPEVAWVTEGGSEKLSERLCVRPTSEILFCEHYQKIINSYRDLPKLYNQWCSVVRWEKTTRPFLRSSEFLWQEGHTMHETAEEAMEETMRMLHTYEEFYKNVLAIPAVTGQKTEKEKFAGAVATYTIEPMMHNGVALQGGTSHYFGDGWAKNFGITCVLVRRDTREKLFVSLDNLEGEIEKALQAVHDGLYERALKNLEEKTFTATTYEEFLDIAETKPGFIKAMWCGDSACEDKLKDATGGVKSRCIPFKEEHLSDVCVCCGKPAKHMVYWGRQY